VKKFSIVTGIIGQLALMAGFWGYTSHTVGLCFGGVGLGLVHFYTMEIDFKGVLQVRPFAYLAVALPLVAIFMGAVPLLWDLCCSWELFSDCTK
jgi:hypothetical protein